MRSRLMRPCLAVGLAGPITFAALVVPASLAHATPLAPSAACSSLKGSSAAPTAKLSGCTATTTGGAGVIAGTGPNSDVVTWTNGGTTSFTYTHVQLAKDACPTGSDEYKWTGTVTASTGGAAAITGSIKALICIGTNAKAKARLLTGTTWTF